MWIPSKQWIFFIQFKQLSFVEEYFPYQLPSAQRWPAMEIPDAFEQILEEPEPGVLMQPVEREPYHVKTRSMLEKEQQMNAKAAQGEHTAEPKPVDLDLPDDPVELDLSGTLNASPPRHGLDQDLGWDPKDNDPTAWARGLVLDDDGSSADQHAWLMGLNDVAPTTDEDSSAAGRADYAFEHVLAAHIPFALVDGEFAR
eukprot:1892560-Rhodomonas_salina.1